MLKLQTSTYSAVFVLLVLLQWQAIPGCAASNKKSISSSSGSIIGQGDAAIKRDEINAGRDVTVTESKVAIALAKQYGWLLGLAIMAPHGGYILGHRSKTFRNAIDRAKGKERKCYGGIRGGG